MVKTHFRKPLGPLRSASKSSIFSVFARSPKNSVNAVPTIVRPPAEESASNEPLFRKRAVEAASNQWAGTIILAARVPMRVAGAAALALLLGIGSLLVFGEYTRKVSVKGQMVPSAGSIKVVAQQFGRIATRSAVDGASVSAGQTLFEMTSERVSSAGGVDARIGKLLQERTRELAATGQFQARDLEQRAEGLLVRERYIQAEIGKREEQIALQSLQVRSTRAKHIRFQMLAKKGFLSKAQLADSSDGVTAQIARQKALESDVLAVQRELLLVQEETRLIENKIQIIKSQAAQQLASLGQEAAEHEGRSHMQVLAPAAGIITALTFEQGQSVPAGATLATILPAGSELEAHLMVPSRAVGFVKKGQPVRLRLSAFSYQKFGQVEGIVEQVERSPIVDGQPAVREPMYRVTVRLTKQAISAYGRTQHFKAGMTLEADVLQERRRLIEWVVEPLVSAAKSRVW